jgi:hypothetical protein
VVPSRRRRMETHSHSTRGELDAPHRVKRYKRMSMHDVVLLFLCIPVMLTLTITKVVLAMYIAELINSKRSRLHYECYCAAQG